MSASENQGVRAAFEAREIGGYTFQCNSKDR
jgi:hypothetical protein